MPNGTKKILILFRILFSTMKKTEINFYPNESHIEKISQINHELKNEISENLTNFWKILSAYKRHFCLKIYYLKQINNFVQLSK